jgi:kinetochore protein Mis13/DSN1
MATNRPTRRRSARQAFDDDDAPAPKRPKADTKKTNGASGAAKKAAKTAYDEDDDGFQFSRRTSRRTTKAQAVPAQDPIPEHQEAKPAAKPVSRRKKSMVPVPEPESADSGRRRRSARISGDRDNLEMRPKSTEPLLPKRTRRSMAPEKEKKKAVTPAPEAKPDQTRTFARMQTPTRDDNKRDPNTQRIMLPFADTPVITRNKEMRKGNKDGHRRSSTGLRGRRASSLIDSGMSNGKSAGGVYRRDQ